MNEIMEKAVRGCNKIKLKAEKNAPELLLAAGIVTFVGTIALACRATLKTQEILEDHKKMTDDLDSVEEMIEIGEIQPEEATLEDVERDRKIAAMKTAARMIKLYAPVVALGALSLACFLTSRNIMRKRYLGAVAAYNAVTDAFQAYRKRVIEEQGDIMDRHYMYGTPVEKVTVTEMDENGKKQKKEILVEGTPDPSQVQADLNAIWWDESCKSFDPNPEMARMFLMASQNWFTERLRHVNVVFVNEVRDRLGLPPTQQGAISGWIRGEGDDYVDFGLYDENDENTRRFMNGLTNHVLLKFNHDGIIWDKI